MIFLAEQTEQIAPVHTHTPKPGNKHVEMVKGHATNILKSDYFKVCVIALGVYALITLVMFWYIAININTDTINGGGDVYQSMWSLWWVNYAIFTQHVSPYFTNMIFYPAGAELVTESLSPLAAILTLPLQWISLTFEYNVIFLLGFILSGLFMFMLAHHITKNNYGSFLAGLIYAFSPMHIAQSIGHLNWTSIEFIPLFILLFLLMFEHRKRRYAVLAGIVFVLVIFVGDPLQGILTILITGLLLIYYLITQRSNILNNKFLIDLGILIGVALVFGSPSNTAIGSLVTYEIALKFIVAVVELGE